MYYTREHRAIQGQIIELRVFHYERFVRQTILFSSYKIFSENWPKRTFAKLVMGEDGQYGRRFIPPAKLFCRKWPKPSRTEGVVDEGRKQSRSRQGGVCKSQSKILPRRQISSAAHSVLSESCWEVPSPNPALRRLAAAATAPAPPPD